MTVTQSQITKTGPLSKGLKEAREVRAGCASEPLKKTGNNVELGCFLLPLLKV